MSERTPRTLVDRLARVKGFVVDMDGTLVLGDNKNTGLRALPGAAQFIGHLNQQKLPFVAFTNGTVRKAGEYVPKLRDVGIHLEAHQVMTPSSVAAEYLKRRNFRRIMVLGGEGVGGALAEAGLEVLRPPERGADAIFVGWFREFGIDDLEAACDAVWRGAKLFTASQAPFFATAQGRALGTSRAIVAMISSITGCRATLLGKPSLAALRAASRRLGIPTTELAVIGDDPELEVPMAHRGQAMSIAVTTGIGRKADFAALPQAPHLVVPNIGEFLRLYRGAKKK
ncbi:MAG: HAD-IIA family hydrolase [Rhizomicrobium sp.]